MKVKELIEKLGKLDQEIEVLCYEDHDQFSILDILDAKMIEGKKVKVNDQVTSLRLGNSLDSQEYAGIEVTSDIG